MMACMPGDSGIHQLHLFLGSEILCLYGCASTSHPRYMSNGVVDAVAAVPSLCEMFHIPFQSGDDEVLKAMGRYVGSQAGGGRQMIPVPCITAQPFITRELGDKQ